VEETSKTQPAGNYTGIVTQVTKNGYQSNAGAGITKVTFSLQ
jgi:hypothetical protein